MLLILKPFLAVVATFYVASARATCSSSLEPSYSVSVASGYQVALVATGLARPRGIHFDNAGHLLVVEAPRGGEPGISALTLRDSGGVCVEQVNRKTVVSGQGVNHGIALSKNGSILYASSMDTVWSWKYDSTVQQASDPRVLVGAMSGSDHLTRTLLLSQRVQDTLIISRGSNSNIDSLASHIRSGHSQIKAFDIGNLTANLNYTYATDGHRLGWGLRNSVGVAEHPVTGGVWSVENSADNLERDGVSIRENNPGEELNFHGYLDGTEYDRQGGNYGYPQCYATWDIEALPRSGNLSIGAQFAADGGAGNDTYCAAQVPPRLTFLPHQAPLDIKFNNSGTEAWISFHGSWNRDVPSGYKLSMVPFQDGQPVAAADNTTAAVDIFANVDNTACPDNCFRPVGLAFDDQGRLFMSSDATGEIYVIVQDSSASTGSWNSNQQSRTGGSRRAAAAAGASASTVLVLVSVVRYLAFG